MPGGLSTPSEAHILLTPEGMGHLLTLLAPTTRPNAEIWKNLPGFYWCAAVAGDAAGRGGAGCAFEPEK